MLVVVEHLPHEGAGLLGRLADEAGADVRTVRVHAGDEVPRRVDTGDALVVLGGDMNTDEGDRFPHLHDERALLERALEDGAPVLGLCLGAQLLAEAAGGRVRHVGPRCGYLPVELTDAGRADPVASVLAGGRVLNLNGDQIEAAAGMRLLATSETVPVQAFAVGERAYGLQFHPEFDAPALRTLVAADGIDDYLRSGGLNGERLLAETEALEPVSRDAAAQVLRAWLRHSGQVASGA